MLLTITRFIFSAFELSGLIILSLSLFRLPIRYHLLKIFIISLLLTGLSFYLFNIANLQNLVLISNLTIEIILITIFFSLPIFYSLLISVIGILVGFIVEYSMTLVLVNTISSLASITSDDLQASILYLFTGIILYGITFLLQRKKIGFMFMMNRFTINYALKGYNFALSTILVVSICLLEFSAINYYLSVHFVPLLILSAVLLIGIYIAYKHNKQLLKQKYERLSNVEYNR